MAPVDLALDSDVPSGAGLSHSAARACAVVGGRSERARHRPSTRAMVARRSDEFVGASAGLTVQAASNTSGPDRPCTVPRLRSHATVHFLLDPAAKVYHQYDS